MASLAAAGIAGWHVASTRNPPAIAIAAECPEALGAGGTLISFAGAPASDERMPTDDLEATDDAFDDSGETDGLVDLAGEGDDEKEIIGIGGGGGNGGGVQRRYERRGAYLARIDAWDFSRDGWAGDEILGSVPARAAAWSGASAASASGDSHPSAACLDSTLCLYASLGSDGPVPAWPAAGTPFRLAREAFQKGQFREAARGFLSAAGQLPRLSPPSETAADLVFVCRSAALAVAASGERPVSEGTGDTDGRCADEISAWADDGTDADVPKIVTVSRPSDSPPPILATSEPYAPSPQTPTHH